MGGYNKIMLYFWFSMFVLITGIVTYMGITEGFERWSFYYIFGGLALLMFLVRRWMMKRMKKHMEWLEEQRQQNNQ